MSGPRRPQHDRDATGSLIGEALAAPGLPGDFEQELAAKLDREFALANDPVQAAHSGALSRLLARKYGESMDPAAAEREIRVVRARLQDLAASPERRSATGLWAAAAGAAAAVLLAALLTRPAFRLETAASAIRQAPSVELIVDEAQSAHPIETIAPEGVARVTTPASYLVMSSQLLRSGRGPSVPRRDAADVEADLIRLLGQLAGLAESPDAESPSVRQGWPRVTAQGVEIRLDLASSAGEAAVSLLIDPATKRPLSGEVRTRAGDVRQIRFRYAD